MKCLRKCVGCGKMLSKELLLRVVKTSDNCFVIDNKYQARGAYICPNDECIAKAKKRHAFEYYFKTKQAVDIYEKLI